MSIMEVAVTFVLDTLSNISSLGEWSYTQKPVKGFLSTPEGRVNEQKVAMFIN